MKKLVLGILMAVSVLVASCASVSGMRTSASLRQCSDTPNDTISMLFQGITDGNFSLIGKAIADSVSGFGAFGDGDSRRGQEIVKQIAEHPEILGEEGSCACIPLSMVKTSDPDVWDVVTQREAFVGDELRKYKMEFKFTFESNNNCIFRVNSIGQKWERM